MSDTRTTAAARSALARAFAFEPVTGKVAREALLAGAGGALAIAVLAVCARVAVTPLILPPFGATCALLFAAPAALVSQPRNVIGGHILSALVGLAALALLGPTPVAMAVGVGVAIAAMRLTGTMHPPAGALPILIVAIGAPWWFFAAPVGVGAVILVVCAVAYHRLVTGLAYPKVS